MLGFEDWRGIGMVGKNGEDAHGTGDGDGAGAKAEEWGWPACWRAEEAALLTRRPWWAVRDHVCPQGLRGHPGPLPPSCV